jgi:hypothetical protein
MTELLGTDNPMRTAFEGSGGPATGKKPWSQIAADWIDSGCPLPPATAPQSHVAFARTPERVGRRMRTRLTLTSSVDEVRANPRGRVLGMGVVH